MTAAGSGRTGRGQERRNGTGSGQKGAVCGQEEQSRTGCVREGQNIYMGQFHRKTDRDSRNRCEEITADGLPLLQFPALRQEDGIRHAFTTRAGGVSAGHLASLNLSFSRGDEETNVRENFRRVARFFGVPEERFVFSDQTHTANVRVVTEDDAGCGLTRPRSYADVDGLVTDVPELVLSIFTADCVPVYFYDPVRRAIGLSHSGWKGTAARIGAETVRLMREKYGTDPADLLCAIGPSICQDCYEVSADVADIFAAEFAGHEAELLIDKGNGKYQLDLWAANRIVLTEAGVKQAHISVTDICTCCNPDLLFSHRASHGMRGNMGAFLMLTR